MAERAQILVRGVVQGVGFRPFVFNLAGGLGLSGCITNTAEGVLIDIEGDRLAEFIRKLKTEAPPLSRITGMTVQELPPAGYREFTIAHSREAGTGRPFTLVSPDTSLCTDCRRELLDPSDRRYLYPFINCTNCGPRYTITRSTPYDRPNTTMASFAMCPDCSREYHDPGNRRFHAQPNACPACGPRVEFKALSANFGVNGGAPVKAAIEMLRRGGIVAIKGLGGFHIACDATNDAAVGLLRERKRKSNKPFAVMCPDVAAAQAFSRISEEERELLRSPVRPIVLLEKRGTAGLSDSVSPANRHVGVLLPYTPLHYLLFAYPADGAGASSATNFAALVMTSGNLAEEPIVRDNDEAVDKLSGLADGFLLHNRDIFMRVDDSVVSVQRSERSAQAGKKDPVAPEPRTPQYELNFIRRSRGYAPEPIALRDEGPEVLGCGADLKNTFTLTKGSFAVPSQHIGDMENFETLRFYGECLENLKSVYRVRPVAVAHDLHPGYLSTRWAKEQVSGAERRRSGEGAREEVRLFGIQHHYAHIGSVMAEHGLTGPVIGVAFDGTGYGTDGNLWGGEFLVADIGGFERAGQLKYIGLPGGAAAIREPWRTAVSHVMDAFGDTAYDCLDEIGFVGKYGKDGVRQVMIVAGSPELSPPASGAGRLFDAVAAILGICDTNTFEGEAAMALEAVIREGTEDDYPVSIRQDQAYTVVDFGPAVQELIREFTSGVGRGIISAKFHNTVSSAIEAVVLRLSREGSIPDVALSGGTFQNRYLRERVSRLLGGGGMKVYANRQVPCNDASISLGQAYLVRERLKKSGVRS